MSLYDATVWLRELLDAHPEIAGGVLVLGALALIHAVALARSKES